MKTWKVAGVLIAATAISANAAPYESYPERSFMRSTIEFMRPSGGYFDPDDVFCVAWVCTAENHWMWLVAARSGLHLFNVAPGRVGVGGEYRPPFRWEDVSEIKIGGREVRVLFSKGVRHEVEVSVAGKSERLISFHVWDRDSFGSSTDMEAIHDKALRDGYPQGAEEGRARMLAEMLLRAKEWATIPRHIASDAALQNGNSAGGTFSSRVVAGTSQSDRTAAKKAIRDQIIAELNRLAPLGGYKYECDDHSVTVIGYYRFTEPAKAAARTMEIGGLLGSSWWLHTRPNPGPSRDLFKVLRSISWAHEGSAEKGICSVKLTGRW